MSRLRQRTPRGALAARALALGASPLHPLAMRGSRRAVVAIGLLVAGASLPACDLIVHSCAEMDCVDGFTLNVALKNGALVSSDALTVTLAYGAQQRTFTCRASSGSCDASSTGVGWIDGSIAADGSMRFYVEQGAAPSVDVRVELRGATIASAHLALSYQPFQPNGPSCGPTCLGASANVVADVSLAPAPTTKPPATSCARGLDACGDACVDLQFDPLHCGRCDAVCGASCVDGACLGGSRVATSIAVGAQHACALMTDGAVWCWGFGEYGALGYVPPTRCSESGIDWPCGYVARVVPGVAGATAIAAGGGHVCALVTGGQVECWGEDDAGQLGPMSASTCGQSNAAGYPLRPCSVTSLDVGVSGAVEIAAGGASTCARLGDGRVRCWGDDTYGQLGAGAPGGGGKSAPTPTKVSGLDGVVQLALGGRHACARRIDGSVWCWGDDLTGQLGGGTTAALARTPVRVPGIDDAIGVTAGLDHTCVLRASGDVVCFGDDEQGQLARGASPSGGGSWSATPVAIPVTGTAIAVASGPGASHTCAVRGDGTLACFGANESGELGWPSGTCPTTAPCDVGASTPPDPREAAEVAAGNAYTCLRTKAGAVSCWGYGESGQLGDGKHLSANRPQAVVF